MNHETKTSLRNLSTCLLAASLFLLMVPTAVAASAQTKQISASKYRVVEVAAVSGDDYASGTSLLSAYAEAAETSERWLVMLSPGTFDLGSRDLQMAPNVSIQGAGMESTLITGQGIATADFGRGVVQGADESRIAELTIRCTNQPGQAVCIALANVDASPRVHRVRLESDGAGSHWGVRNTDSSPILEEVEIYTQGGVHNYGIVNSLSSFPEIQRSILTSESGSEQNIGVFDRDGGLAARIDDTEIYAVGGTYAVGLYNDGTLGGSASLDDVTIHVDDGTTVTAAIYGGNYSLHLQGSSLVAGGVDAAAVQMESNASLVATDSELLADSISASAGEINLGATRISNGGVSGTTATCSGIYRLAPSPGFFADECPGSTQPFATKATRSVIRISEYGS